jgi:hypothetical protein
MSTARNEGIEVTKQFAEGATTIGRHQMALVVEARQQLLKQIADATQFWSEGMKRSGEVEAEFVLRLADCHSPAEALQIYTEWFTSSAAAFMTESRRLGSTWFNHSQKR